MEGRARRVLRNALPLYGAEFATRLAQFAFFVLAARYLDPAAYGQLAFAATLVTVAGFASDFGAFTLLTKLVAQEPEKAARHVAAATALRLALVAPSHGLALLYAALASTREVASFVAVLAASSLITAHSMAVSGALRGRERMLWDSAIRVGTALSGAALSLAALHADMGIVGVALGQAAGALLGGALFAVAGARAGVLALFPPSGLWAFLRAAAPFGVQGLLVIGYLRLPYFVLERSSSGTELGLYGAAYRLVEPLYGIPGIFGTALFPLVAAALGREDREEARRYVLPAMQLFFLAALPMSATICFCAEPIVALLFPAAGYGASAPVLAVVCMTLPATFLTAFTSMLISASRRPGINTGLAAGMVGLNAALNLALVPALGARGAAIACVATEYAGLVASAPFVRREALPLSYGSLLWRPLVACTIALPALALGPFGLVFFLAAYAAIFTALDRGRVLRALASELRSALGPPAPPGPGRDPSAA